MNQAETTTLIERSKAGDQTAFRRLVELHQSMVFRLAFRLLCNEEDARDATQEAFIRAWTRLRSFDTSRTFSTWIYAITSNYCLDRLKAAKRWESFETENLKEALNPETPETLLLNRELGEKIRLLTSELSPKQKLIFTLSALEDLSVPEIVQITGMTRHQIKSNLHFARKKIKKQLNSSIL